MTSSKKIIIAGLATLVSVAVFAKPPHAKSHGAKHFSSPPEHAKAWGKKHDWKNMSKEARKNLKSSAKNKAEDESPAWVSHAKALGRELLK